MLQYQSVYPETLDLLKEISEEAYFSKFFLVGGTAIALYLGHRISVDLDFFTQEDFDTVSLHDFSDKHFSISNSYMDLNTVSHVISYKEKEIKTEYISYKYDLLKPIHQIDGIRILDLEDLTAMKLSAINGRGAKKDFVDVYFLLERFSLKEMISLYMKKYKIQNSFQIIKSLLYFFDADQEPEPIFLKKTNWDAIKERIQNEVELLS
ncbi:MULTISPECIES: nucleotidyl transferase AbiEii/AbiGii toxin family protein [unclassified Lentimicrobium]|uniref:nucleotidyl transferase AbiEii/AbiGii toxin family protein n=1 Tax=unclassified Lentimicrobium TaxID=2677434 RepID=UPI001555A74D|nr:nucleotidyl transferase AbiEii/AbiGii toxin family protein [Lentimicrobium sp. S6]NPD85825.1 nucleotidyl transferase AbiEii/AbiGii toxin family protein [Lentimicrobium sp. L6]